MSDAAKYVPTGVVPRPFVPTSKYAPKPDPIAQAVDDYLLMERKARAWDALRAQLFPSESRVLALMDRLVHPAHPSAPADR
jgi:hypothetical protein